MSGCDRHSRLCAYTGTEPDRCPLCHSAWAVILACPCHGCRSRENHLAVHAMRDAAREKNILRNREKAAGRLSAGHSGAGSPPEVIPEAPVPP